MVRRIAGVVLFLLGAVAAVGWSFYEKAHFESAQSGLGGDLVDKGRILWQPEAGFIVHTVLVQFVALGLGALGIMVLTRHVAGE